MYRFIFSLSLIFNSCYLQGQEDIFIGSLPTKAENSFFEKVATSDEYYYFGSWNLEGDDRTVSIFQTTFDFEVINSIENLKIFGVETSYLTYLDVVDDKVIMISSAKMNDTDRLYSHSLDLDLSNHSIIDSLEFREGEEFVAHKYKTLNNANIYAFGNISQNNTRNTLSANYIEFTKEGDFLKFEVVDIPSLFLSAFDYNPSRNQYIVRDFANSYLLDSSFAIVYHLPANIPPVTFGELPLQDIAGFCNFESDTTVQCIGRYPRAEEYTNFVAKFGISEDSLFYFDAISLHPADLGNERTTIVHVSIDEDSNYFFSYQEPFFPQDGNVLPNTVYISKFDKDFSESFFIELNSGDEYAISENILDKENNLIIVGGVTTNEKANAIQNFYIKVSKNGEILTNTLRPKVSTDIKLFPNPCTDYIRVGGIDIFGQSDYHIYSLDGRLLLSGTLNTNEISTAALPAGMYLLNIVNESGIYASKFVKRNLE